MAGLSEKGCVDCGRRTNAHGDARCWECEEEKQALDRTQRDETLRQLLAAYRKKRANDGLNGRRWDAASHLEAEDELKELGENDAG